MGTAAIRQIIKVALDHERSNGELLQYFERRLPQLQRELALPVSGAAAALVAFVCQYVNQVPEFIESVSRRAAEYGAADSVTPFLHMAEDFFLAPPADLPDSHSLQGLLDEAFLAQRLIEEVNDRHIHSRRRPLLLVDMTRANIIVHHLIGDTLANRLNQLVEKCAEQLIDDAQLFVRREDGSDTSMLDVWQDLPCMSSATRINLRLPMGAATGQSSR